MPRWRARRASSASPTTSRSSPIRTIASGGTWGEGFETALTAHVRLKNQTSVNAVLTDREFEVMDSFAAGMSIQAIAETLNITPETVKKHGQRAMHKLGANSRWQAVAMWLNSQA